MQLEYASQAAYHPVRFVRWAGFGIVGGLMSAGMGVWLVVMGVSLLDAPGGDAVLPGLLVFVLGALLALGGVVRVLGVSGARIDPERGTLKVWRGLIVPMSGRTYSLAAFTAVNVATAVEGGGRHKRIVYPVSLVGAGGDITFHVGTNYVSARQTAIGIARLLGYLLRDSTGPSPVIRTAESLGVPLRDRESVPFASPADAASNAARRCPPPLPPLPAPLQGDGSDEGHRPQTTAAPASPPPSPRRRRRTPVHATRTADGVAVQVPRPTFWEATQFTRFMMSLLAGFGVVISILLYAFSEKPVGVAQLLLVPAFFAAAGMLISMPFVLPTAFVSTLVEAGRRGLQIRRRGLLLRSRQEIPAEAIDEIRLQYGFVRVITRDRVVDISMESLDGAELEWAMQLMKLGLCA